MTAAGGGRGDGRGGWRCRRRRRHGRGGRGRRRRGRRSPSRGRGRCRGRRVCRRARNGSPSGRLPPAALAERAPAAGVRGAREPWGRAGPAQVRALLCLELGNLRLDRREQRLRLRQRLCDLRPCRRGGSGARPSTSCLSSLPQQRGDARASRSSPARLPRSSATTRWSWATTACALSSRSTTSGEGSVAPRTTSASVGLVSALVHGDEAPREPHARRIQLHAGEPAAARESLARAGRATQASRFPRPRR